MKKSESLRSFCLLVLLGALSCQATAAPYGREGREIEWQQPDGRKLKLRVFGDDHYGRTETADGYTVAYNEEDGAYHYAGLAEDGSALVPLPLTADQPAAGTLFPHLDLSEEKIREKRRARHSRADAERERRWAERVGAVQTLRAAKAGAVVPAAVLAEAEARAAKVVGSRVGLTILVQFPNDPQTAAKDPVMFPTDRNKIVRYCNGVDYTEDGNTGSVRDFYYDQSLGKLTYTQSVTPVITLPKPRNYYNFSDYPANRRLRNNSGDLLLADAIKKLKAIDFDFSSLSSDGGNKVIATNVFFAGPDSGVWSQGLWPYQTTLPKPINVGTDLKPLYISAYQQTNIADAAPVIGTFCHENGHLLFDYSDLYDYGGESQGVGDHCLMGGGNYNNGGKTPSPINAYFKDIVGWGNVVDITSSDSRAAALPTTGNVACRIRKPGKDTEYFIVENRGEGDKWARYSVDQGIAIWHIDEDKTGDNQEQMTSGQHYEVSLEQADGRFDLENNLNYGDRQDLFDLSSSLFSDTTKPDARWWDGTASKLKVEVLTPAGASMDVRFGPLQADRILVSNPNGGEVVYPGKDFVLNWEANITGNVRIELLKGGVLHSILAADEWNSGSFVWAVPGSLPLGTDYRIRVSSLTNAVPVSDSSDSTFAIGHSPFPANDRMPYGWRKPKGAASGWTVTKSAAFEGAYSLSNKPVRDGGTAAVSYTSDFNEGNVSFLIKASTEKGHDFGRFSIDGVARTIGKDSGNKGISGQTPWIQVIYHLPAGTHTLEWSYHKDDTYLSGADSIWIDGVILPTTTQEIAVEQPAGTHLVDGESSVAFPDTPAGSSSKSKMFTIRNLGKADLTGLRVVKSGADGADFTVGSPGGTVLAKGGSTTFEVAFAPRDIGEKDAVILVLSNDDDEPAFRISLNGTALGVPEITVSQPSGNTLKDGKDVIRFGFATVKARGRTREFTITNSGSATLGGLVVSKTGDHPDDFLVGPPGTTSLAPGKSTTFTVTFTPTKKNGRTAGIRIASNDRKTGPFNIGLTGTGAPRQLVLAAASPGRSNGGSLADVVLGSPGSATAGNAPAVTSFVVIGGRKYLSLTVTKPAGTAGHDRTVEVTSNLLDWSSGKRHTTVLIDDATTLKVRDNTPTTPDAKRYIRLHVTPP